MKLLKKILRDTLMRDKSGVRRYSRTSLTMLTAWVTVLYFAISDFIFNGLRYDVWVALLGVATVVKIADSTSKKISK